MPETGECAAHLQTLQEAHKKLGDDRTVEGIQGDAASTDPGKHPRHVIRFGPKTRFKRGTNGSQTPVMLGELLKSRSNPDPPDVSELGLVWDSVHGNGRAVFLVFGRRVFKIAFLTHTSVQLYRRDVWEGSVMKVDRDNRGFRVGIAFEFKEWILAFVSIDLVFQPEWFTIPESRSHLAIEAKLNLGVDVQRDFEGFVASVTEWTVQRRNGSSKRAGLACEAMRDASLVWVGVGVYTVCELFFLAGCSPFLLEYEVFDCPSRTARLCEALWCWTYRARNIFTEFVRPAIAQDDYIIAPTEEQRLRYTSWLHVWGKKQAMMSRRMKSLLVAYKKDLELFEAKEGLIYRDEVEDCLYDAFEPQLILEALQPPPDSKKSTTFGHLTFGLGFWHRHGPTQERKPDPLTKSFIDAGLYSESSEVETHLRLDVYEAGLEEPNPKGARANVEAFKGKKQMWSVYRPFPSNLVGTRPPPKPEVQQEKPKNPDIYAFDEEEMNQLTFEYIVKNTNKVAIGPLEYCGHGKVIKTSHGYRAFAVHGDPRLPEYHCLQSLWRVYTGKGLNKTSITNADLKKLNARFASSKPLKPEDMVADAPPIPSTPLRNMNALPPSSPLTLAITSSTVVATSSSPQALRLNRKRKSEDADKENLGPPVTPKKKRVSLGRGNGIRVNWEQRVAAENVGIELAQQGRPKRERAVKKYTR